MMSFSDRMQHHIHLRRHFAVQFLNILVGAHGTYIVATTLLDQLAVHHSSHINDFVVDLPLLIGLSLIYLSTLLRRRKRTAWTVTVMAYAFYLGISLMQFMMRYSLHMVSAQEVFRLAILPASVLLLLFVFEKEFVVKSDIQGFRHAARFSIGILLVALLYGTAGYTLLDNSDFHEEITVPKAVHYTIDQFDLTTTHPLTPHTRRAHLFDDSLTFVSIAALAYAALSLFQPLRVRLADQRTDREHMQSLLTEYGAPSEEFFKLWPHDKQYYFDASRQAGLAFHVYRGVALCVSDPIGNPKRFKALLQGFQDLCFSNDWQAAFVHVSEANRALYESHGFALQKLGQDAVVDMQHFQAEVARSKYFRQINNKFTKQGYTAELLQPPHHQAVLDRLKVISDDWLSTGGRAERGFALGYYSEEYMQQCDIMIARDAAGTIQAFANILPTPFAPTEVTYDLLRQIKGSLGNVTDFLLMNLITVKTEAGYTHLNLGLCPLAGLDESEDDEKRTLLDNVLTFAYANGDRFYSFSGLYRFKSKYKPQWDNRYLAYQGGVRGFSKSMTALTRTMRNTAK